MSPGSPSKSQGMAKLGLLVDNLFVLSAALSAVCGVLAFLSPHMYGCFLIPHGEATCWTRIRDNSEPKDLEPHLAIRLYGTTQIAFAWISWCVRSLRDGEARRSVIRAYFAMHLLALLSFLRANFASDSILTRWNWVNILVTAFLSSGYGYFCLLEAPAKAFSGAGRV
jgi:hypothetical protein